MPKKFKEQEKEWIRQKLLDEGKRRFEAYGLRKTSVEDLTKAVGISQGSFYLFFGSKEELFYELLLVEETRIQEKMLQWFDGQEKVTKENVTRFFMESFQALTETALIRIMYFEGEFEQLVRRLSPEKLEQHIIKDRNAMLHVVDKWQEAGVLRGERPELIVSMFRSLVLLSLHQKEIGHTVYHDTIDLLVRVLVEGMFGSGTEEMKLL